MVDATSSGGFVRAPHERKTLRLISFRVAASAIWSNLPKHLRRPTDDSNRRQFVRDLETFLFAQTYTVIVRCAKCENARLKRALQTKLHAYLFTDWFIF